MAEAQHSELHTSVYTTHDKHSAGTCGWGQKVQSRVVVFVQTWVETWEMTVIDDSETDR